MYHMGIGWDVHRLEPGRKLLLGGVHFEDASHGLKGHSDGDVVCHAICDALLGAMALGDIGEHFPDTDAAFKDFPGIKFLERVRALVAEAGGEIVNVDCTVMSDAVRLDARKKAMAHTVALHLGLANDRVSIKATTWEGRGAVGRGEVIACQAIAAVTRRD